MDKKILILTDCDGTLLSDDYNFSEFTIETTKEIYEKGHLLIPITARTLKNLKNILNQLNLEELKGIIAANNGAQIYDFKNKKFILNSVLNKKIIQDVFNMYYKSKSDQKEDKVNFTSENYVYSFGHSENTLKWSSIMEQQNCVISSPDEIKEEITSISIITKKGTTIQEFETKLKKINEQFGSDYKIDAYHNRVISIAPKNIDKGYAAKLIIEYLKPEEYITYGFGDSYNDISLFNNVDNPIAMLNGIDELKKISKDTTKFDNTQDGVCRYLKDNKII
ncbi:HAD superfamily hydrolase [Entomoplasma ellychniae]|uniref:HAD superfamily hydrolase n=1 Tax=Entomoplasma ellychniae TaxID=2114 RepID=A0A8E2UAX4_9MOLU|nr:HAD-IIB family hydrolase [Entomoplasma ellychniae]PPE04966.1 HAD superfamily hydrolase [Entomoplasma ellychniae]